MGPGIASGPHSRLLARVRFGDCRSGWEEANRLRMFRSTGIAARFAQLPGYRSHRLRVSNGFFAATFPVVQKDRQSSIAPLHRRPIPFLASRDRLRSHPPGAKHWRWPKPKLEPAPPLRVPGGRIRTAVPLPFGVVRTWPKPCPSSHPGAAFQPPLRSVLAALQACFPAFRRPRSVGWRTLIRGRIACKGSLCFSRTCIPIRSRFLLRDNTKLRSLSESRKTYFCHLSTGRDWAVDNVGGPRKRWRKVSSGRARPAAADAAR